MPNDAIIQVRLDAKAKAKATSLFKRLGLSTSDAIRLFIAQAIEENGFPFLPHIPNRATREALADEVEPVSGGDLAKQWADA